MRTSANSQQLVFPSIKVGPSCWECREAYRRQFYGFSPRRDHELYNALWAASSRARV